jgi:hypothetical protein
LSLHGVDGFLRSGIATDYIRLNGSRVNVNDFQSDCSMIMKALKMDTISIFETSVRQLLSI